MKENANFNKTLLCISMVYILFSICFYTVLWISTNNNIKSIKEQNKEYFNTLQSAKNNGFFQIEYNKLNEKQVLISPKEIGKINDHINYLSEQVYKESDRAQRLIDNDIDRLNLYMAIGIGFMTIIGVFVPILINVLSYQDLKEKLNKIDHVKIDKAIEDSTMAIEDSKTALKSVEKVNELSESVARIEKNIDDSFPKVSTLILQNAIGRYFNVAPQLLMNLIREKDRTYYIQLLETIRNGFEECRINDKHTISSDKFLQSTITDFARYIRDPKSHSSTLDRGITNEFYNLYNILQKFLKVEDTEEETKSYQEIDYKINEIIELIKKSDNA